MSDYSRGINHTAKDALSPGDPNKTIKGVEMDSELDAIATASATKANKHTPVAANNFALLTSTGDLADGGTQAVFKATVIPVGTKMMFIQAASPTGWTQDNTVNDRVLRIIDNTGVGAATGGSWTLSGVTVDDHTLSTSEIPSHDHNFKYYMGAGDAACGNYPLVSHTKASSSCNSGDPVQTTGGGGAHNHGVTLGDTWRPSYVDAIVCTRDSY